jgi:hypothetical protein
LNAEPSTHGSTSKQRIVRADLEAGVIDEDQDVAVLSVRPRPHAVNNTVALRHSRAFRRGAEAKLTSSSFEVPLHQKVNVTL